MGKKENAEKDKKRAFARFTERGDQVWRILEDEYLGEIMQIRDELNAIHQEIKAGGDFSKRDIAIGIMASLVYGELLKRAIERKDADKLLTASMKNKKKID